MFHLILFSISLLAVIFSVIIGAVVVYHFKRFGIKDDPNVKRFLNIFMVGGAIIILFVFILLFSTVV